tara:strand:- start:30 stop:197 length:168 start_codon:yes stop_codon:yes gene_type:complete
MAIGKRMGALPTSEGIWVNGNSNLKGFKAFLPIGTKPISGTNDVVNMNVLRIETH